MKKREQVCSQQVHCLSCPLAKFRTGKFCEELSQEQLNEIMRRSRINDLPQRTLAYRSGDKGSAE